MIEVERKFVVDDDAELPGFESLAPSLRVGSVETIDLDALYYDTTDYRLARTGAALRLRLGGPDTGWHLKIPGQASNTRIELRRPTPQIDLATLLVEPPEVPDELVDLTLARTGGRELHPVVRLSTRRTRTVLVGPESRPLAEVDEDEVGSILQRPRRASGPLEGTRGGADRRKPAGAREDQSRARAPRRAAGRVPLQVRTRHRRGGHQSPHSRAVALRGGGRHGRAGTSSQSVGTTLSSS